MEQPEKTPGYLVYAGPRPTNNPDKYIYLYYKLSDLDKDIEIDDLNKLKRWSSDELLFKVGSIGSIYEVSFVGPTSINYSPKGRPCALWPNVDHRTEWKAFEIASKKAKAFKADLHKNTLIDTLQPIRNAYKQSTAEGRRNILAEVLRVIAS